MHPVIHFHSSRFDLSLEPEAEDWRWYSCVIWDGRTYLIGACAYDEPDGNHEWVLQFEKHRCLKERLFGREKMTQEEPCFQFIRDLICGEPAFAHVDIEYGP